MNIFEEFETKVKIKIEWNQIRDIEAVWSKESGLEPQAFLHKQFLAWVWSQGVSITQRNRDWFLTTNDENDMSKLTAFVLKWL